MSTVRNKQSSNQLSPLNWLDLLQTIGQDFLQFSNPVCDDQKHLQASIDWLLLAFNRVHKQGFSAGYSLKIGWKTPYPETTGYIIPTLLNFANWSDYRRTEIIAACITSGEWLLTQQKSNGSFWGYNLEIPIVFDTGQIIFGLCALYQHTKADKYLDAARRAADWLVKIQNDDGSWTHHTYNSLPHAYHSRVAWSLLELNRISHSHHYVEAATKNLDWVTRQMQTNGWFNHFSFFQEDQSVLHTIAYTLRGLLESGLILDEMKYVLAAKQAADQLLTTADRGILSGFYNRNWEPVDRAHCLTGLAQMGIVWLGLFEYTADGRYADSATKIIHYLKSRQKIRSANVSIRGALAGSFPIWGRYIPFIYPNWSVKFFIDLLLSLEAVNAKIPVSYKG